jgi:hypothetical protein
VEEAFEEEVVDEGGDVEGGVSVEGDFEVEEEEAGAGDFRFEI